MFPKLAEGRETQMKQPYSDSIYSTERLALVLKGTGLGLWDWNPQTGQVVFDERWCQMLGYELDEIVPSVESWSSRVHPDDLAGCFADIQAHIEGDTEYYSNEHRMLHKDGSWVHILDRGRVMERDSSGAPIRFTGSHEDITARVRERKHLIQQTQQLKSANQQLEYLRDQQSHLYAVIGHELRTPAAILKMLVDAHSEGELLEPELFANNLDHLLSVLDTLRAVAQPHEIAEASTVDMCVRDLIMQLSLSFSVQARRAKARIITDLDGLTGESVRLPRTLIRQVLSNLIKNCLIHSGCSRVTISAQGELLNTGVKRLRVTVADDGIGIPNERIESLFSAYVRGDTRADGTGLGLYVCREIIRRINGDLRYEALPVSGGQFVIELELPLSDVEELRRGEDVAQLDGKRILLAEDDRTLQLLTQKLLTSRGANVVVVDNGQVALEVINTDPEFDLVLTDIFMPTMDGYELVKQLRHSGIEVPVIALTAATIGSEVDQILDLGADAVLNKPLDLRQLASLLAA